MTLSTTNLRDTLNGRAPLRSRPTARWTTTLSSKTACITRLTFGPYVMQIWSRNTLKFRGTNPAYSTEWHMSSSDREPFLLAQEVSPGPSHARVLEGVAKSQFSLQGSILQELLAPVVALKKQSTPSTSLARYKRCRANCNT